MELADAPEKMALACLAHLWRFSGSQSDALKEVFIIVFLILPVRCSVFLFALSKRVNLNYPLLYYSCHCSVAKSCLTLWSHGLQHTRFLWPTLSLGVCSNSCPLSRWCCLTMSSSVAHFSFCRQSFPASGSFPVNWLFMPDNGDRLLKGFFFFFFFLIWGVGIAEKDKSPIY